MNETLEAMAQAIFKSWFVDFDPVIDNALRAGNPIPADLEDKAARRSEVMARDSYKKQPYAHLFPDHFVDSDLGATPAGWEVTSFSQVVDVLSGGTPKRSNKDFWGGHHLWFSMKDLGTHSEPYIIDTDEKITDSGLNSISAKLLNPNDTIVTARGTVGKTALVDNPIIINQSCYGIRGIGLGAFYTFLATRNAVETLKQVAHGAVFDTITRDTFKTIKTTIPSRACCDMMENHTSILFEKIKVNQKESRILASLRDTLLPKLISGEIRVPEIEGLVEEAL